MPVPFDTHAAIQRFTASGLTQPQAEALSTTLQEIYSAHAVTRADFDLAMAKIDARFDHLEDQMDARFARLEATMDARGATIDQRFGVLSATTDQKFTRVDAAIDTLRNELHRETHTLKWGVGVSLPVLLSIAVKLWFF